MVEVDIVEPFLSTHAKQQLWHEAIFLLYHYIVESPDLQLSLDAFSSFLLHNVVFLCTRKFRRLNIAKQTAFELYNTRGTVHGYDMMLKSGIVKALIERRTGFLKRALR